MTTQHTPGPWEVDPAYPADIQARGYEIATTWQSAQQGAEIRVGGRIAADRLTQVANARLIASAPDMLDALQQAECAVEQLCHGQDPANQCWVTLADTRAAIAKATGNA